MVAVRRSNVIKISWQHVLRLRPCLRPRFVFDVNRLTIAVAGAVAKECNSGSLAVGFNTNAAAKRPGRQDGLVGV